MPVFDFHGGNEMAKLTADQVIALRTNQYNRAVASYGIVLFGMVASVAATIAYGPAAPLAGKLLLALAAISIALYAALAIPAIWTEADGLRQEPAEGISGTAYEKAIAGHQYGLYGMLATVAAVVFVLLTLWMLFG